MKDLYKHLWAVIHLAALNFRKGVTDENEYTKFYMSLGSTMNCQKCITHYNNFIQDNPIDFDDLFGWTVKLHNSVNQTRGEAVFTREESLQYWIKSS